MFLLATEQSAAAIVEKMHVFLHEGWERWLKLPLEFILIFLIIYAILRYLRGSRAVNVLVGIIIFLLGIGFLARSFNFEVFGWLLSWIWTVFATALVVIFQQELRRALALFGSSFKWTRQMEQKEAIEEITGAMMQMSFCRCGALIVLERKIGLAAIINSAVVLDAKINSLLLQSLFYPNSPLHDGALIVQGDNICAAHAILPITQEDFNRTKSIGTRHRAAIGVTEETDAVALVVSEESGTISVAFKGRLIRNVEESDLLAFLKKILWDSKQPSDIYDKFQAMREEKILDLHPSDSRMEGRRS